MLLVSTGFKSAILGPQSFADIFNGGELRVFAGARPNSADKAQPSDPIGVVRRAGVNTGLAYIQEGAYIVASPGDLWLLNGLQPGTAAWFRLVAAGDDGTDSFAQPRIDGDIGTLAAPNDMTLASLTIAPNTAIPFSSFLFTIPPLAA